jgi:hypothetical protein
MPEGQQGQPGQGQPASSEAYNKQQEANVKASVDAAKKEHETREKLASEQRAKIAAGKVTPTQDENDRARLGEHIKEHADDGSGPDPHSLEGQAEAHKHKNK